MKENEIIARLRCYHSKGVHICLSPLDDGSGWYCTVYRKSDVYESSPPYTWHHTATHPDPRGAFMEAFTFADSMI